MKTMRDALREHIDVTQTAKRHGRGAAGLAGALRDVGAADRRVLRVHGLRQEAVAREEQAALRGVLSACRRACALLTVSIIEQILNCYGVGKDGMDVLAQLMVASKLQGAANEHAYKTILAGLSGVETLDGKATGRGVDDNKIPEEDNSTLKLLAASLADKAITYKMPHPELNIPGVPDVDDQETPREHIKRTVRGMMPDGETKKIQ